MNKKVYILILILLMLVVFSGTANAITGNPKVDWLINEEYVKGDANGYRLDDKITRAETTKMVVEAGGLGNTVLDYRYLGSMFKDIKNDHWANGYINVAVINSLVNGYPSGLFIPNNDITYAEVIKMLVMANKDIPDTEQYTGSLWAIPYILKADELGITEGVKIKDFYESATREKVFELVFNTMFKEQPIMIEEYKGIVIENKRTSRLKEGEISLVVFEDLNSISQGPRYKEGDKILINLPKKVEDVEYLLGKVVDIKVDKNNIALDVKVDRSYSYLGGPILASKDSVYLGTNGKYYDIREDKLYKVYHNDDEYDYKDYIDSLGSYDSSEDPTFLAEHANLTVRDGRAYFIDSYTFSDISPVSEVIRGDIYIYDDQDDGKVTKSPINFVVGYTDRSGFETLDMDDIEEGDIVHIYNRDSAIVRRDSKGYGRFDGLIEDQGYYFAEIDREGYQIRVSSYRRPVYSVNGNSFKTLYIEELSEDIADLMDQEIKYLLDINGHIQSIE